MYFIYLLILFAINFIACFFGKTAFDLQSEGYLTVLVFQFIFLGAFGITLIVTVCQQLNLHTEFISLCEKIKTKKKEIELSEAKFKELSTYFEKYLGNDFPAFEKEILTAISQKPEKLTMLFQTFPELQSSFTLNKLMENIHGLVNNVYEKKSSLEEKYEELRMIYNCPWLIVKPTISNVDLKAKILN
jgi:hypothetical protein